MQNRPVRVCGIVIRNISNSQYFARLGPFRIGIEALIHKFPHRILRESETHLTHIFIPY
jgi:hypothetical protein